MAKANPIEPFPADVDRIAFGHWLSGFADGEGSFLLHLPNGRTGKPAPRAEFRLTLRADELPILRQIQAYFGCGNINQFDNARSKIPNAKPIASYYVGKRADLVGVVIPHFEQFPLRAKKAADFVIWCGAIAVWSEVGKRNYPRWRDGRNRIVGVDPKWTADEIDQFRTIMIRLKQGRAFVAPASA